MSDVKRYDCYGKDALGYDYPALSREAIDGDWVLAEDHIAECDALAARLAETERDAEQLRDFAQWLTGCGYDFTQHEYFVANRHLLAARATNSADKVQK